MKCRFDPHHKTEFPNAVALSQHYIAEHGDVYSPPQRLPCPECGKPVSEHGIKEHMKRQHGAASAEVVPVQAKKAPPQREPWNPKQVVVPVVRELFGEQVPTDSLGEVIDFAEATRRLIERSQQ